MAIQAESAGTKLFDSSILLQVRDSASLQTQELALADVFHSHTAARSDRDIFQRRSGPAAPFPNSFGP